MYIACGSIASVLIWTLFTAASALEISAAVAASPLRRRAPFIYDALGDSYAAGTGAGEPMSPAGASCQPFSESYPNLLNRILTNGDDITLDHHHACVAATADRIMKNQRVDPLANMVTIGFGLEHINFTSIVNDCVYLFKRDPSTDCDVTLHAAMKYAEATFPLVLRDVIQNALEGDKVPGFQLFLVGFARFWNEETDQCDQTPWIYWDRPYDSTWVDSMTKDRRRKLNDFILRVNEIMNDVVAVFREDAETRVHFVNYDDAFAGHRFCEKNVLEPQGTDESRPEAYFFQYRTSRDQQRQWGANPLVASAGSAVDWISWTGDMHYTYPLLNVSRYYRNQPIRLDAGPDQGVPIFLSKIFHPTPAGHAAIADAIKRAIPADTMMMTNDPIEAAASNINQFSINPASSPPPPPPSSSSTTRWVKRQAGLVEQEITCAADELSLNFPRAFFLEDGHFSVAEMLKRIRDHVCNGICGPVPGIQRNLTRWQRQSLTGCEYAVKVGPAWELFFSATDGGDSCHEATTMAIEKCMTEKDRKTRLRSGSTIDGPNDGESYAIGIRPLNGEGSNHPAFPAVMEHIPYMQLSCKCKRRFIFTLMYYIQVFGWNDQEKGGTLKRYMRHELSTTIAKWHWRQNRHFWFHDDHTFSEHTINFRAPQETRVMPEVILADFWDLEPGSFACRPGRYHDIPIWKDANYDITWNSAAGMDGLTVWN